MANKKNCSCSKSSNQAQHCTLKSICIILMLILVAGESNRKIAVAATRQQRGMAESFTDGLKYAGKMFGINTAADVANLVAKAFSNAATTTTQTNSDFLTSFFQQKPQHTTSQENEEETASNEPQQEATHNADRHTDSVPPGKENLPLDFSNANIIKSVLRMIGFDARKLGALAINALIMIAQAIGSTLMGTFSRKHFGANTIDGERFFMQSGIDEQQNLNTDEAINENDYEAENQPRSLRDEISLDWFLENPSKDMKNLLQHATDTKLTDQITNMIVQAEKKSTEGKNSAACLKMFVCKSSPFIWGMQKSLEKRLKRENTENENEQQTPSALNTSMFYTHLPSIKEFREHGDICQQRYGAHCRTSY